MNSAHGSDIILNAKLHRPRVTKDLIVRPRLLALLDAGLERPLSAVVAPAGFGKTTLVSSWIEEVAMGTRPGMSVLPAAWLSLDESDSDLNVFLRYFISALQTVFPSAAPKTLELLNAQQPPLSVLAGILSNEIEGLPSNFIMVLDDAHVLRGRGVFDFLTTWTHHWPRPMHLVLASRLVPPLPLTSLRARGSVIEIRSRDLRFTATETAEYLGRALGSSVEEPAPTIIHQKMEGWIAGLKLVTLFPETRENVTALPREVLNGNSHITGYLIDEVLLRQPAGIQQFLLKISITPQFCESLCKALLGDQDPGREARQCLDYLEANELFLNGLDNRREWYRLHQLLRDLLQHRLRRELGEETVNDLHGRAAHWYAEHDLPDQAIHHALAAGSFETAARFMQKGLCDVLNREDRPTLERWLRLLPEDIVRQSPELLMMKVWGHALRWDLEQIAAGVERAETLLDGSDGAEGAGLLRGQIAVLKGSSSFGSHQYERAAAYCREGLALLPEEWRYARGVGAVYLGMSLYASGCAEEAEKFLSEQYESARDKTDGYALRLLLGLTVNFIQAGNYENAERTAQAMLRQAVQGRLAVMEGWAHNMIGLVNYEWNELPTAARHFAEVVALFHTTQRATARNGMIGQALACQAMGRSADALEAIDRLSRIDIDHHGQEGMDTAAARARLMLMWGQAEGAERWADLDAVRPADQSLLPWMERPALTRARILIARNKAGDVRSALQILDLVGEIAECAFNVRLEIEILALRALAQLTQGDSAGARETLIRSVEMARRGNFTRTFIDLGPQMEKLMAQIAGHRAVSGSVRAILAAFEADGGTGAIRTVATSSAGRDGNGSTAPDQSSLEHLTVRELEVLALMAEPMSLAEISKRLHITHSTAKRHTINVYEKLGVHGRWEAVARAVELGILRSG